MARRAQRRSRSRSTEPGPNETLHTVRRGQSLWDIATAHYGLASKWRLIYDRNKAAIGRDPNKLEAGSKLIIPPLKAPDTDDLDSEYQHIVKADAAHLEGRKLLQLPVTMLHGVSDRAAKTLDEEFKIKSIFDLALARLFNAVRDLIDASSIVTAESSKHGFIPGDIIRGDPAAIGTLEALLSADIEELNFKNEDNDANQKTADRVRSALAADTVRDLGNWPPFQAARGILQGTFNPYGLDADDPEAPVDLIPQTGNYATERARYASVVMTDTGHDQSTERAPTKDLSKGELIDLTPRPIEAAGTHPFATGVRITNEQSWYARGVTLGQLTHSLALAPGESTQIAVVDWKRRTAGSQSESDQQSEQLAQSTEQTRAISEITEALAKESQHGSSTATSSSIGGEVGVSGGFLGLFGGSAGSSTNSGLATNVSHTSGTRALAAEMTQNIQSNTEQLATSARSRRASVVRETFESESEDITTRVVTNYNHMHALSIQYYEVVQVYRVVTKPVRFDRVLFIPIAPINFTNPREIVRNKAALARAARTADMQRRIIDYTPPRENSIFIAKNRVEPTVARNRGFKIGSVLATDLPSITAGDMRIRQIEYACDGGAEIAGLDIDYSFGSSKGELNVVEGSEQDGEFELPSLPLSAISKITLRLPAATSKRGSVTLLYHLSLEGGLNQVAIVRHYVDGTKADLDNQIEIVSVDQSLSNTDTVMEHLGDNALYYSQAIWASLDTATLRQALADYTLDKRRIIESIDLKPIAITGNYLGFVWNFQSDEEHAAWMTENGYQTDVISQESMVPLPSDGVFAEAVLGRFNSAEKLDMTRFWDWQDSPIPILPPGIDPISTGSRAQDQDLKSQGLAQPAVQIVQPNALPDPTGMQSVLQGITASNIFRDMSGLAASTSALETSLKASSAGASHASEEATKAYDIATKHHQAMTKMAMEAGKEILPLMAGPAGIGASSMSKAGAVMNMASKIDKSDAAAGGEASGGGDQGAGSTSALKSAFSSLIGKLGALKK